MKRTIVFILAVLFAAPATAQMAVTTIGETDAGGCYENANNALTSDTSPCDRALKNPTTTRADRLKTLVNRGVIHNRNGAIQAALDDFSAALEIDGQAAEAYLNRGNSFFLVGRLDDALNDYERSLELDVKEPWAAWYNIGLVHDVQENEEEARKAYAMALTLNPDFILAQQKLEGRS